MSLKGCPLFNIMIPDVAVFHKVLHLRFMQCTVAYFHLGGWYVLLRPTVHTTMKSYYCW